MLVESQKNCEISQDLNPPTEYEAQTPSMFDVGFGTLHLCQTLTRILPVLFRRSTINFTTFTFTYTHTHSFSKPSQQQSLLAHKHHRVLSRVELAKAERRAQSTFPSSLKPQYVNIFCASIHQRIYTTKRPTFKALPSYQQLHTIDLKQYTKLLSVEPLCLSLPLSCSQTISLKMFSHIALPTLHYTVKQVYPKRERKSTKPINFTCSCIRRVRVCDNQPSNNLGSVYYTTSVLTILTTFIQKTSNSTTPTLTHNLFPQLSSEHYRARAVYSEFI